MRKIIAILLLCGLYAQAPAQEKKPLRVFLIGNSFSQNASRYLGQIVRSGGHHIELGRAEIGGCPLQRHWDSVQANLLDSARGKAYNGKSLKELLSNGTWDVVTIQQYSLLSGDEKTYYPYAEKLYAFIKQLQPDAKVMVHQTWAYRSDAKKFGRIDGTTTAASQKEMWAQSRAAYHALAKRLGGLRIIPSGDAFYQVATDARWAFQPDETFDTATAVAPALPAERNSLNVGYSWTKEGRLKFDPNHANEAGCYLAGLVWYGVLFGEDPAAVTFRPDKVPEDFAAFLKQTASGVVTQSKKNP